VIVRGLPPTATEGDIGASISNYRPVGVRVIRDRGYGFIEFATIPEAERFMDENFDTFLVQGHHVHIDFSRGAKRDDGRPGGTGTRLDWLCGHCGAHNFARRAMCFQCALPKDDNATVLQDSYYNPENKDGEPNPVLAVLGLGPDSTPQSLRTFFNAFGEIMDIRLMKDKSAMGSRGGFAFVEFASTEHASMAINRTRGMLIDGRPVKISFSRDQGKAANPWKDRTKWERPANLSESFKLDPNTGRYYDKESGFYYDPASCLYHHSSTGVYYRWDATNSRYLQVDERGVAIQADTKSDDGKGKGGSQESQSQKVDQKKKKEKKKKSFGSIAFTIKKAPTKPKPAAKVQLKPSKDVAELAAAAAKAAAAASAALAALKPRTKISPVGTGGAPPWASLSASPATDPIPEDLRGQKMHLQLAKKICTLCKRKFQTLEKLFQHVRISALHRKNLQLLEVKRVADADRVARSKPPPGRKREDRRKRRGGESRDRDRDQDRDRGPSAFEQMVSKAASVKKPIEESNKGSRMLKAMGWKKGQGLGKNSRGITAPVNAEMHVRGAGLGSVPSGRNAILPGDSYQNAGIKKARARYERAGGSEQNSGFGQQPKSAASAYLAAMNEYQSTMCSEKDTYARAMLK